MRILSIMKREPDSRNHTPWLAYLAAFALAVPLAATQASLAQSSGGAASEEFVLAAPSKVGVSSDAPAFTHRPVQGRLTGTFGARPDAFTGELAFHAGVDISADLGTPIVAPANGRVIRVTTDRNYGNVIEIDHGGGFALRYAHLSAFDVSEGDTVQAGQLIGRVGNTGRSSGAHLHLEVWRNDRALDPAMFFDVPSPE